MLQKLYNWHWLLHSQALVELQQQLVPIVVLVEHLMNKNYIKINIKAK